MGYKPFMWEPMSSDGSGMSASLLAAMWVAGTLDPTHWGPRLISVDLHGFPWISNDFDSFSICFQQIFAEDEFGD